MRVGILGAGFIAKIHAEAYQTIPCVTVTAIGDVHRPSAEALAGQVGAVAYADPQAMIREAQIDVVDICLPTFLHEQFVLLAAENGKHILCEKPVALSLESIERMIAAVEAGGVIAMIAQVLRFWGQYGVIRDAIQGGKIGNPQMIAATRLAIPPASNQWIRKPELSGGALLDLHVHDLDYVYSLFGLPQSVYAVGAQSALGAWDHVVSTLNYGAFKAVVEASFLLPREYPFTMTFRASGDAGCVDMAFQVGGQVDNREHAVSALNLYQGDAAPVALPFTDKDAYQAEIEYFVDSVRTGKQPAVASLQEGREVLRIVDAARRSLETNQVIPLESE